MKSILIACSLASALVVGTPPRSAPPAMTDAALLEHAIRAAETADYVDVLKYLYAYVERGPQGMEKDSQHAQSVQHALRFSENVLRGKDGTIQALRDQIDDLKRRLGMPVALVQGITAAISIARPKLEEKRQAAARPRDEIRGFRLVEVVPNPTDHWDLDCNFVVEYAYDKSHGKGRVVIGTSLPGASGVQTGHSYWGNPAVFEEEVGGLIVGTQQVSLALRLTDRPRSADRVRFNMYVGGGSTFLDVDYAFELPARAR